MTRPAPCSSALRCAIRPTAPHPHTAIVSPGVMSQKSAPVHPVGTEADRNSACSSVTPSGTWKQFASACGTRTYVGVRAGEAAERVAVARDRGGRVAQKRLGELWLGVRVVAQR